jgi:glycosyltransferase involved in cell wall biosynthesis
LGEARYNKQIHASYVANILSSVTAEPAKTRILHVITGLATGGAEIMLLKLLSANRNSHCQAVVSLKDEGTMGPRIKELGVPVYSLGLRPSPPNPFRVFSIKSIVRQFHPDIIQGWMYHGNLAASFASLTSQHAVAVLWSIHQSLDDLNTQRLLTRGVIRIGSSLSRYADGIVYVSRRSAKQHQAFGYRPKKQVVIPNGFECQVFRPNSSAREQLRAELGVAHDAILVGLIARYHPVKDHAGFLAAARLVGQQYPKARFVLVGSGVDEQEPLFAKVQQDGQLRNRVFLLGERSDVPYLTAALDISCSASWGEAFSTTIGEAMACGVPCVVTDVGDSAEMVQESGMVVPPRNPEAMAEAIVRLIEAGTDCRRKLGLAARQRIEKEFSLPAIAGRYEEFYRELIPAKDTGTTLPRT